jgi:hypothetical protein
VETPKSAGMKTNSRKKWYPFESRSSERMASKMVERRKRNKEAPTRVTGEDDSKVREAN